jgi:hypothetical protein
VSRLLIRRVAQADLIREQLRNAELPASDGQQAYRNALVAECEALKAYTAAVEELAANF